ncbi:hypothetical protein A2U01_0039901, partial [Trifolium medium]|nr:hypothetical protein [Trifolium medium]
GIIIGRDKISVNISRFQRIDKKGENEQRSTGLGRYHKNYDRSGNHNYGVHKKEENSYAQAVKGKYNTDNNNNNNNYNNNNYNSRSRDQGARCVYYKADKDDVKNLQNAYVGVVDQSGISYNIHDEFHTQGYFGIKERGVNSAPEVTRGVGRSKPRTQSAASNVVGMSRANNTSQLDGKGTNLLLKNDRVASSTKPAKKVTPITNVNSSISHANIKLA